MKKICLYARSGQNILYGKIGLFFETEKYSTCYIVQNAKEENVLLSLGCNGNIYNLTRYIKENWNNATLLSTVTLAGIENKYQIDSIWRIFYTDRFLVKYNYQDAVKFIKLHVRFIEYIYEKHKPDILLNEEIALFSSYIFYIIGKFYNCRYIGFSVPRNFSTNKFALTLDEYGHFNKLDYFYKKNIFTENEIQEAIDFIKIFQRDQQKPEYMKFSGEKSKLKLNYIYRLFKFLIQLPYSFDKYNYEVYQDKYIILCDLINYLKSLRQKIYYQDYSKSDNYYLFPLHFQPEASTLVKALFYEKQLYTIDQIAKRIPGDSILYVKEHYAKLGHRETSFYKKLKEYPNVKLINPWLDSHELILNSQGVITLTGTVGWEAILYGIPVFVLGNVFYDSFRYVNKIKSVNDLTQVITQNRAVKIDAKEYHKELSIFVAAYLKSLYNGNYYLADKKVNDDTNVELLYKAIINYI